MIFNVDDNLNDCRPVLLSNSLSDNCSDEIPDAIFNDNISCVMEPCDFGISVRFTSGNGYHWEFTDDCYGVDLFHMSTTFIEHPDDFYTSYCDYHIISEDYYIKLILIDPNGNIVDEVDSNMINSL
ncbi:hypothetical protein [uncultured Methanobrevibacter sp.]|uniref:hypothetical protein n=1 Tax=uncultured Methanobrevibacter sp. TaxID=253161 RepID=UPI0025E2D887|nr:hypothetical protein [uncultured Methanobrevibacter sp.]